MATTYDVGLKWVGGPEAQRALADAAAIRASLGALEAKKTTVGTRGGGAEREQAAQMRMQAQAVRSIQQAEAQKRTAAFRRLQQSQREEEAFVRYRIALDRRLVREKERAEQAILRAELQRIRAAQRAEAQAAQARSARYGRIGSGVGSGLQTGLKMAGGAVAGGVGLALGGAAVAGKQGLDTVQLIEGARMRLTASLGSTEAANKEIKDAFRIAEKTIFDPRQMVEAMSQLSTNFKALDMRRYVLGAVSDFATVSGKGEEGMKSAIIAINQIVAKGKLQQEELTGQLGELGLPARKVYDQLAVILKVKGKDDQERTDKVIKMITAGKVGSDVAVQAITQVMRDQAGGGAAGSFAKQNAGSLEGQISNLKSGFATLFAMSDMETWPALVELRELLGDISTFFGVDSQAGQEFMTSIRNALTQYALPAIQELRKSFAQLVGDPKRIDNFVNGLVSIGRRLFSVASAVGWAVEQFVSFYGWITRLDESMGFADGWIGRLYVKFLDLGVAIGDGIAAGIKSAGSAVYDGVASLASGVVNTVRNKLDMHSPSRVMAQLGAYTAEGFGKGIEGGASRVMDASRMLGDAATSGAGMTVSARAGAAGGAGGASYTINNYLTLPIQTSGSAEEMVATVGPLLDARIEAFNDRYFGRLAAQGV